MTMGLPACVVVAPSHALTGARWRGGLLTSPRADVPIPIPLRAELSGPQAPLACARPAESPRLAGGAACVAAFAARGAKSRAPRSPRRGRRDTRGYTLIEVIVAFALLALALTLLLGTLSGSIRQVRWSGEAGRAALHAQSLLDTVGVGEPLRAGRSDGEFDDGRYRWSLAVTPWEEPLPPNTPRVPPGANRLYELALSVQWGDGPRERLQLRSLRLAPAPPATGLP